MEKRHKARNIEIAVKGNEDEELRWADVKTWAEADSLIRQL